MKQSYTVLGTDALDTAIAFYNGLFAQSGPERVATTERMAFWQGEGFALAIALPFDEAPAMHGNGTMIGFDAGSEAEVDRLHALALELGGTSEGAPGPRGPRYSAYVRDLDKNKLCFFA